MICVGPQITSQGGHRKSVPSLDHPSASIASRRDQEGDRSRSRGDVVLRPGRRLHAHAVSVEEQGVASTSRSRRRTLADDDCVGGRENELGGVRRLSRPIRRNGSGALRQDVHGGAGIRTSCKWRSHRIGQCRSNYHARASAAKGSPKSDDSARRPIALKQGGRVAALASRVAVCLNDANRTASVIEVARTLLRRRSLAGTTVVASSSIGKCTQT